MHSYVHSTAYLTSHPPLVNTHQSRRLSSLSNPPSKYARAPRNIQPKTNNVLPSKRAYEVYDSFHTHAHALMQASFSSARDNIYPRDSTSSTHLPVGGTHPPVSLRSRILETGKTDTEREESWLSRVPTWRPVNSTCLAQSCTYPSRTIGHVMSKGSAETSQAIVSCNV